MKYAEIKGHSVSELQEKVKELREEIFRLKWQKSMKQLENSARIKSVRKDLARVLTLINEKNK